MTETRRRIAIPARRDARWAQILVLGGFTVLGQATLHFAVSLADVAASLLTAITLDLLWQRRSSGGWSIPLSAAITGTSIGLLLRCAHPAVFAVASVLAVGSKHLLRRRDGRHVWNPSNLGIVLTLAFTSGLSTVTPGQWGTSTLVVLAAAATGALVVSAAGRLPVVVAFTAAHIAAAVVAAGGAPAWSGVLGASTLVFAFFMITDPATAPASGRGQVAYGIAIALLAQVLVAAGSAVAPLLALLAICPLTPLLDAWCNRPSWRAEQTAPAVSARGESDAAGTHLAASCRDVVLPRG